MSFDWTITFELIKKRGFDTNLLPIVEEAMHLRLGRRGIASTTGYGGTRSLLTCTVIFSFFDNPVKIRLCVCVQRFNTRDLFMLIDRITQ